MKYTKEERLDIGRRIYDGEMSRYQAAEIYDISEQTARDYMRLYCDAEQLPPKRTAKNTLKAPSFQTDPAGMEELESLTKEQLIQELVKARITLRFPSHGYRWLNAKIRLDTGLTLSDPYAHKCCKTAGIKSKAKHYRYKKPGDPYRVFPNLLLSEMQIDGPLQCIVSDMTAFCVKGIYYELTLYMDLWNNEIVSHSLSSKRGDRMTYISGLEDLIELKRQHPEYQMILHSDQGSVYASKAFSELLPMYGITRSMSRAGTPTDNAAMEAINGWIKAELFMDLHVTGEKPVQNEIDNYILFFSEQRPAYSLNYLTPKQYRESNSAAVTS